MPKPFFVCPAFQTRLIPLLLTLIAITLVSQQILTHRLNFQPETSSFPSTRCSSKTTSLFTRQILQNYQIKTCLN